MTKNMQSKQPSFALIYAVLLMLLISITIAAISTSTLSDIRRLKKTRETIAAYQIANAGIEDGIVRWKNSDRDHCSSTIAPTDIGDGKYDLEICSASNYIISTAHYKYTRMRFRADVSGDATAGWKFTIYQVGL